VENRTIKEIENLIIDQLEASFNFQIPLLSKAFNRVLAKVLAGVWQINYKTGNWIFLQLFVSTASFKSFTIYGKTVTPLIEWGQLVGVGVPDAGSQARLEITITNNSPGETLPSGTQFISSINNIVYITDQAYLLAGATQNIEVIATVVGSIGNLSIGDPISMVNPLGIIDRDAVVLSIVLAGEDQETEESYRLRVGDRFKQRPQGGALVDYRIWASDVAGVLQSYWYTGDIPTHVIGFVSGDAAIYSGRIPTTSLLEAVGEAVTYSVVDGVNVGNRKPLGAIVDPAGDKSYSNIKPITVKAFDVDIIDLVVDNITSVKTSISQSLELYFDGREPYIEGLSFPPTNNTVQQSAIIGIIQTIVQANNGTFLTAVLSTGAVTVQNYVLEQGELSALDQLTYNGA